MTTDNLRGEVTFYELGEGLSLMFRAADCRELQKAFGAEWFTGAAGKLDSLDLEFMMTCLKHGLKKDGKPHPVKDEDIDKVTLNLISRKLLDGLLLAVHGKTFSQMVEDARQSPLGEQA